MMARRHSCPQEGSVLRDPSGASFEIGEKIGSGAFGLVFRATRTDGDRPRSTDWPRDLVVKWQPRTPNARSEGDLHRRLKHKNVVRCLAAWENGDNLYAVLEYCSNGTLKNVIENCVAHRDAGGGNALLQSMVPGGRDHFSLLLCDMVGALAYCSEKGVVHCDIKPENILVDGNWTFKLADFGLSSTVSRGDYGAGPAHARGTQSYMAPEVFDAFQRGDTVQPSAWTDAYSLGLTLLQAVRLNTRPVLGGTDYARKFHRKQRNVEVQDNDYPASKLVQQVLRQMLRHDKEARITAKGALELLEEANLFEMSTAGSFASLFSLLRMSESVDVAEQRVHSTQPGVTREPGSASPATNGSAAVRQQDANATPTSISQRFSSGWSAISSRVMSIFGPGRETVASMLHGSNDVSERESQSLVETPAPASAPERRTPAGAREGTTRTSPAERRTPASARDTGTRASAPEHGTPANAPERRTPASPATRALRVRSPWRAVPAGSPNRVVSTTPQSRSPPSRRVVSPGAADPNRAFGRALRAFHKTPFEFQRARTLFNEALSDNTATDMERARAHLYLYVLHSQGWGGPDDDAEGQYREAAGANSHLLLRVVDEHDAVRAFEMGICHYFQIGSAEKDDVRAHSLFLSSANGDCVSGMVFLGCCLLWGEGVERDAAAAAKWWRRADDSGHFGATFWYGSFCLYEGVGVQRNESSGVELIRFAAEDNRCWGARNWLQERKAELARRRL